MATSTAMQNRVEENWATVQNRVRAKWPQLSQADLDGINGDMSKLVALVHQKTGAAVTDIEQAVDEIAASSGTAGSANANEDDESTVARLQHQAGAAWHQAEDFYQEQPVSVLLGVFAVGLIAGAAVGSGLHDMIQPPPKRTWKDWTYWR